MRLSNTLVVAYAAVLLASGHALSETANVDQATVSKLAPSELRASIDSLASENKRSLRSYDALDDDDDEDDDDDDDEEERYQQWKIDKLRNGKWKDLFLKWNGKGHTPVDIEKKLKKLSSVTKDERDAILKYYK